MLPWSAAAAPLQGSDTPTRGERAVLSLTAISTGSGLSSDEWRQDCPFVKFGQISWLPSYRHGVRAEELRGSSPRHHRGGPRRQVLPARARYCGLAAAGERGARPSAPCPRRSATRARASSRTRERVTLLGAARHTLPKVPRCSHCLPLAIATTARASAAGRLRSAAAPPTSPAGRTEKQRTGGGGAHREKERGGQTVQYGRENADKKRRGH
jgi:hypothetical protein